MAVIFGEDALSDRTIAGLLSYIEEAKKNFAWGSNVYLWPPTLTVTNGAVLTHRLPAKPTEAIFAELVQRDKLPYHPKDRIVMFYSWLPGSSITWHSDYLDKNSMTVYLSKDWRPDHGGYFCWRDWDETFPRHSFDSAPEECRMRLPKYNHYVYMTDAEWHTTTITAPTAPPRLSLQMFFGKP